MSRYTGRIKDQKVTVTLKKLGFQRNDLCVWPGCESRLAHKYLPFVLCSEHRREQARINDNLSLMTLDEYLANPYPFGARVNKPRVETPARAKTTMAAAFQVFQAQAS